MIFNKPTMEVKIVKTTITMIVTSIILLLSSTATEAKSLLLGSATGLGSCASPPYRATKVHWVYGCPPFASCCSEFGYCRAQVSWNVGMSLVLWKCENLTFCYVSTFSDIMWESQKMTNKMTKIQPRIKDQ